MSSCKAEGSAKSHKVYLVDDHSVVRDGLAKLINGEEDLTVCGDAGNIQEAFQGIEECKPDIVIVDITLKDGSGIRLIENLTYSNADLPVLVLSMHDESVYAERCIKAGAKGYIMKQEPSDKMISAIRKVLNGRKYLSDKLEEKFVDCFFSKTKKQSISPLERLTNRELEVYQLIGQGLKKRAIAGNLNISVKTVENHMEHIKKKIDLKTSHEIILHAVQNVNTA
jgi:DNA-binding NarL/FixJ family response regulator